MLRFGQSCDQSVPFLLDHGAVQAVVLAGVDALASPWRRMQIIAGIRESFTAAWDLTLGMDPVGPHITTPPAVPPWLVTRPDQ